MVTPIPITCDLWRRNHLVVTLASPQTLCFCWAALKDEASAEKELCRLCRRLVPRAQLPAVRGARPMVQVTCAGCHRSFLAPAYDVARGRLYCSRGCQPLCRDRRGRFAA